MLVAVDESKTMDGTFQYTWDAEGRLAAVNGVQVTYDALGRMVEQSQSGAYTQFVYSPLGAKIAKMNGQALVNGYVALPGGAMAVYDTNGLAFYRHADFLGTSPLATTPNRTLYASRTWVPFGETYNENGAADRVFTGKEESTLTGLFDFPARRYNPVHGRWIAPDPGGLGTVRLANPQSLNRYVYVMNRPSISTDQTGMWDCTIDGFYWPCSLIDRVPKGGIQKCEGPACGGLFGTDFTASGGLGGGSDCTDTALGFLGGGPYGQPCAPPEPLPLPPPEPPSKPAPQCFAQLKYRAVNDPLAKKIGATHSFWYIQSSDGGQDIISGGPQPPNGPDSTLNLWINPNINSGVDNVSAGTWWNSAVSSDVCVGVDSLFMAAKAYPNNKIAYAPGGPNSNSLAHYLAVQGGFSASRPPGAFGWDIPIPFP